VVTGYKTAPTRGCIEVCVRLRVEFKLSPTMDLVARSLTGYWAPYAWMEIEYRIPKPKTGPVTVSFSGSNLPSQAYYVDWTRMHYHDMRNSTKQKIDGFINNTPGCSLAPGSRQYNW